MNILGFFLLLVVLVVAASFFLSNFRHPSMCEPVCNVVFFLGMQISKLLFFWGKISSILLINPRMRDQHLCTWWKFSQSNWCRRQFSNPIPNCISWPFSWWHGPIVPWCNRDRSERYLFRMHRICASGRTRMVWPECVHRLCRNGVPTILVRILFVEGEKSNYFDGMSWSWTLETVEEMKVDEQKEIFIQNDYTMHAPQQRLKLNRNKINSVRLARPRCICRRRKCVCRNFWLP